MIPERARARTRPDLLTVLGSTASACGFSVNSVLVHLGDAFGLYPTGQYSFDHELPDTSRAGTCGKLASAFALSAGSRGGITNSALIRPRASWITRISSRARVPWRPDTDQDADDRSS
jgi:hypothetical protein